ncbi:MAG: hypothetical protein U0T07_06415 [Chitinophagales bacterium]
MNCKNCHTTFELSPIEIGKSRYCSHCGFLIYKNENGNLLTVDMIDISASNDMQISHEINMHEQEIRQEHAPIKNIQQKFTDEQKLKDRLLQIQQEKDKLELERLKLELEEQKQQQQIALLTDQSLKQQVQQTLHEKQQLEIENKLLHELEQERKAKEQILLTRLNAERQERDRLEKELHASKQAKQLTFSTQNEQKTLIHTAQKSTTFIRNIAAFISFLILLSLFLYKYTSLFSTAQQSASKNTALASTAIQNSSIDISVLNNDTAFLNHLKTDIANKNLDYWNDIQLDDIKALELITGTSTNTERNYIADIHLEDKIGTKAIANIDLAYQNSSLQKLITNKITYVNIAPKNAWFSFAPFPNCDISINTNNNPIQLKSCAQCNISKLVSDINKPIIIAYSETIFIKSDNQHEGIVEFTYLPKK